MNVKTETIVLSCLGRKFEIAYFYRPGKLGTILFLHGLGASKEDFRWAFEDGRLMDYNIVVWIFLGMENHPIWKDS